MTITYRGVKGQAITAAEYDETTRHLYEHDDGVIIPKEKTSGVKIDPSSPDFGWHDMPGTMDFNSGDADAPSYATYNGDVKQLQFVVNDKAYTQLHIPHDYLESSDILIHIHWSHNSATYTTGQPTFTVYGTYAKGHNQAAFGAPVSVNLSEAPAARYQHMITETPLTAALGAGGLIATENLEVDGVFLLTVELTGNTMDGGALPFIHFVDCHYQSTGVPTKNNSPDFYL